MEDPRPLVLVVAASQDDRDMYFAGLQAAGFAVACSGIHLDVAAVARQLDPSVVVAVLERPERDGWNTCIALHLEPHTAHIPIVILTAAVRPDGVNRLLARRLPNCAAFVAKPCDHIAMAHVLQRVLAGERGIERVQGVAFDFA